MNKFNLGEKVSIIGKNASGTIVYIGKTHFAGGEWFGIILDQPKGRNNGSVDGQIYFKCPRNYGTFVRSCQLEKQSNDDQYSNSSKTLYPNYLESSSKSQAIINKLQNEEEDRNETIARKEPVIKDVNLMKDIEYPNNLKNASKDQCSQSSQNTKVKEKQKILKIKNNTAYDVNKNLINENMFKELLTASKQVEIFERKLWVAEKNLEQSEKRRLKLEKKVDNLKELTEFAIVDKEIAEELLQEESEKCKQLLAEIKIMKQEMKLQRINGTPAKHYVKKLENENAVFSNALYRLRDLYNTLRQRLMLSEKSLEINSNEIRNLKETEDNLQNGISKYREEIEELYETIDGMLYADELVHELAERNLNSEDTICLLTQALKETEEYIEVSDEVEETLKEIKLMCNEETERLESTVKKFQHSLNQKNLILRCRDEVIEKYRELTSVLRYQKHKISEEFEKVFIERKEAVIAAESIKLKNHQVTKRTMTEMVEIESLKIDLNNFKEKMEYWAPFMPNKFFQRGGENFAIQVRLTASKMSKKLNLLIDNLKSLLYEVCDNNNKQLEVLMTNIIFLVFAYKLRCLLEIYCNSVDRRDFESFLSEGKNYDIMLLKNSELDHCLKHMCNEEIDRKCCLDSLRTMYRTLSEHLDCRYASKLKEIAACTDCYLNIIRIICKCILELCLALSGLKITADHQIKVKQVTDIIKTIETNAAFIILFVKNCDKENTFLVPAATERLKIISTHIQVIMEKCMYFYNNFTNETKDASVFFSDQKTQDLNEILTKLEGSGIDLAELQVSLKNGELLTEYTTKTRYLSAVAEWAEHKKQEYDKAIQNLRKKVASLESNIRSLTQDLLKQKSTESKKIGTDSCQDDKDCQVTSKNLSDELNTETNLMVCGGDCLSKIDYLLLKQKDMESSIKYLSKKNFKLKMTCMSQNQMNFVPLVVPPKQMYHSDLQAICILQKRLNMVAIKLRGTLVSVIVDITKKHSNNEQIYRRYLRNRLLVCKEVEEEIWKIVLKIRNLRNSPNKSWSYEKPFSLQNTKSALY